MEVVAKAAVKAHTSVKIFPSVPYVVLVKVKIIITITLANTE